MIKVHVNKLLVSKPFESAVVWIPAIKNKA